MFASAMVLLARTRGIPARVVGGYRVTEVNPLSGRAIVRDRDAHAWVEAWLDGEWRGWDPTPTSESFGRSGSTLEHLSELASFGADRALTLLGRLRAVDVGAFLLAMLVVLQGSRWI